MGVGIPALYPFITVHHRLFSFFTAPCSGRWPSAFGTNTPPNSGISGLDTFPVTRDAFWNVIEPFHATTFCDHEPMFNLMQPKGAAWQVLVGSGGSPWDAKQGEVTLNPATDRSYAWATVTIRKSGKVELTAYGFSDSFGPTRVLQHTTLAAR